MEYCIAYNKNSKEIIDFLPVEIDEKVKNNIIEVWNQKISREILITLSEQGEMTAPKIKEKIGHSASTLHENIKNLEEKGLIKTEMIYKGNKQKVIKPKVLCITKNPRSKERFKRFFRGLFVDTNNNKKIIEFLKQHPQKYFSIEEISAKTKIPSDEIEILLNNWESQITRSFSDFMKEKPFEKKTLYRFRNV
ncbi:MAG: winged helix-turn-helix transcriptional regulator [Nanobdellota archaeon]